MLEPDELERLKYTYQDELQDYYFYNLAKHNEDFIGYEMWLDNLTEEEVNQIIK